MSVSSQDFYGVSQYNSVSHNQYASQKDIALTLLNGLYQSSNPNLHKYRDYDPFLKGFVKLKDVPTGPVRAAQTQQEHQRNYVVNQTKWNNGPVKLIERDRIVIQDITESATMGFGDKCKTENERIRKHMVDNPIDAVPPADRRLICNPNWREHAKNKWMDDQGFKTGLKVKFPDSQTQAWVCPPVRKENDDVYIEGQEELGNRFRERQAIKEITYKEEPSKYTKFATSTKNNYLHKHPFLIKSTSHRTLDAQNLMKQVDDLNKGEQPQQQQQYSQKIQIGILNSQSLYSQQKSVQLQPQRNQSQLIINNHKISIQDITQNESINSKAVPVFDSKKVSLVEQISDVSVVEIKDSKKDHSSSLQQTRGKSPKPFIIKQQQQPPPSTKNYLKSIENFVPTGLLTSSLFKDQQLSNQVQIRTYGRVINERPITATSQTSQMFIQKQTPQKILIQTDTPTNQPITINIQDSRPSSSVRNAQIFGQSKSLMQKRPQTALMRSPQSRLGDASEKRQLFINPNALTEQVNLPARPPSAMHSTYSRFSQSTKNTVVTGTNFTVKDAISKHFDSHKLLI